MSGMVLLFAAVTGLGLSGVGKAERGVEPTIRPVSLQEILTAVDQGQRVVFVDVREPQEFAEYHIPGSINLPTRAMRADNVLGLEEAALLIPYAVGDERDLEGGRRLRALGLENLRLIQGYGVASWRDAGLPLAGALPGLSDLEALQELGRRSRGNEKVRTLFGVPLGRSRP